MPMFPASELKDIHDRHVYVLRALGEIEKILNDRFYLMEIHTRALALAALSGEALLLVGPPGTAKSRLIREFCRLLGLVDENGRSRPQTNNEQDPTHGYFEYLLTRFTEPSELFGFYNIRSLVGGDPKRIDAWMMQHARVVFLDEVFNASSAILNSLLAVMNERLFHDHGERREVALEMLFAATNEVPQSGELSAFLDRFLIRSWVENVSEDPEAISELIARGWSETYAAHGEVESHSEVLQGLRSLRDDIAKRTTARELVPDRGDSFHHALQDAVHNVRRIGASQMSNRRIVKLIDVMLLHCLYRHANGNDDEKMDFRFGRPEYDLIKDHFLDRKLQPNEPALDVPLESLGVR